MRLASALAATAFLAGAAAATARAQGPCSVPPATNSGITLRVSSVKYARSPALQALVVQIAITNGTGSPVYVKSAQWGEGAKPSSGTGVVYFTAVAHGIDTTQGLPGSICVNNPSCSEDLNSFSALSPHSKLQFTYDFSSMLPPKLSDDITFPVILVTRFGDSAPQMLRFQFNSVPAACS